MHLIEQYINGTLDEQLAATLHEELERRPELARKMSRIVHVDLLLRDHYNAERSNASDANIPLIEFGSERSERLRGTETITAILDDSPPDKQEKQIESYASHVKSVSVARRPAPEHFFWAKCGIGVLLLCFVIGVYREFVPRSLTPPSFNAVAQIVESVEAEWEDGAETFKCGQELQPNSLKLKSGIVKLKFGCGAEVVLEGPGELLVKQKDSAFFRQGRLSAYVPPEGIGFEIATPLVSVIDRGTAFSMQVSENKSDVHVLKGMVDIKTSADRKQSLLEGFAALLDLQAESKIVKADPTTFFSDQQLRQRKTAYVAKRKEIWNEQSQRQLADPSMLYSLDAEAVVGLSKTSGSRDACQAVCFRSAGERLNVDLSHESRSLTLVASVRLEKLRNVANTLLMSDDFFTTTGAVHWQINRFGVLQFHLSDHQAPVRFDSEPVIKRSACKTWTTLALVADADRQKIVHYVDGRPVSTVPWPTPIPLHLNRVCIGNEAVDAHKKGGRFFDGAIENFWIFDRALSPKEIDDIFQNNR